MDIGSAFLLIALGFFCLLGGTSRASFLAGLLMLASSGIGITIAVAQVVA